jgi:hypothetical protein
MSPIEMRGGIIVALGKFYNPKVVAFTFRRPFGRVLRHAAEARENGESRNDDLGIAASRIARRVPKPKLPHQAMRRISVASAGITNLQAESWTGQRSTATTPN